MRQSTRTPLRFSVVLSLIMCACSSLVWIRSHRGVDYIERHTTESFGTMRAAENKLKLESSLGQVRLLRGTYVAILSTASTQAAHHRRGNTIWKLGQHHSASERWTNGPRPTFWNRLGFARYSDKFGYPGFTAIENVLIIPLWLPVCVFLLPPLLRIRHFTRVRKRVGLGLCTNCGYDLRATPACCPECGALTDVDKDARKRQ